MGKALWDEELAMIEEQNRKQKEMNTQLTELKQKLLETNLSDLK